MAFGRRRKGQLDKAYYCQDLWWKGQTNRAGARAQHFIKIIGDRRISKCQLAHEAPGRMNAIYTAGLMARNRENGEADVFVHDVNRVVEHKFSKFFLCKGYLTDILLSKCLSKGIGRRRKRQPTGQASQAYGLAWGDGGRDNQQGQPNKAGVTAQHFIKIVGDSRISKCQLANVAPGIMNAIYTAGLMARNRFTGEADVFVHDVDRVKEDKFSKFFLYKGYLTHILLSKWLSMTIRRRRKGQPAGQASLAYGLAWFEAEGTAQQGMLLARFETAEETTNRSGVAGLWPSVGCGGKDISTGHTIGKFYTGRDNPTRQASQPSISLKSSVIRESPGVNLPIRWKGQPTGQALQAYGLALGAAKRTPRQGILLGSFTPEGTTQQGDVGRNNQQVRSCRPMAWRGVQWKGNLDRTYYWEVLRRKGQPNKAGVTAQHFIKIVGDPRISRCQLAHVASGLMNAIYTAGLMGINRENREADVFVHDVDKRKGHLDRAYYWEVLRRKGQPNKAGVTAQHFIKIVGDPRISRCQLAYVAPGIMNAIYTAGLMGRNRENGEADEFVHDVDRWKGNLDRTYFWEVLRRKGQPNKAGVTAQHFIKIVGDPRISRCQLAHVASGLKNAIYTAGLMGRNRENREADVFVHDVDKRKGHLDRAYYWEVLRRKGQPNKAGVTAQHFIKIVGDPRISRCQLAYVALGIMNAIYTAGLMGRNRENGEADVFVHDVDRETVEGTTNRKGQPNKAGVTAQHFIKIVGDSRISRCQLAHVAPGIMITIYTAGLMGRNRENGEADVFVHDVTAEGTTNRSGLAGLWPSVGCSGKDTSTGHTIGKCQLAHVAQGIMNAIYTAGLMGRNRENGDADVFVHDVDRVIEDQFSKFFLCKGYLIDILLSKWLCIAIGWRRKGPATGQASQSYD
ncbi:hypothetical protein DKX38_022564 [Salix brachista]|uniref:Uncharacterized protein n=1 Tax=Salix brachista TaxID=2182728 RepID=A0A5N5K5K1_9ROSI|nr:hypothetical protein DKX38_022564 [Salix brachista]